MKKRTKGRADKPARTSLRQQVLLAALDCSKGDLKRTSFGGAVKGGDSPCRD
jgi:hypothetical protein